MQLSDTGRTLTAVQAGFHTCSPGSAEGQQHCPAVHALRCKELGLCRIRGMTKSNALLVATAVLEALAGLASRIGSSWLFICVSQSAGIASHVCGLEGISDGERYHGTIKSWGPGTPSTQRLKCTIVFNVRKAAELLFPMCLIRFGFITCPDLAQRFTRDVYLSQAACFSACEAADHRQTEDDGSLLPVRSTRIGRQARP